MSSRGMGLLLLVIAGVAMYSGSGNPDWGVIKIMMKIMSIFAVIFVVVFVFSSVFRFWPRGLEGLILLVGLIVLGLGSALPKMPELRVKQAAYWDEYVAKMGVLDRWRSQRPKGYSIKCVPNTWDINDTMCQYIKDTDKTATGCFKNGVIYNDDKPCLTKP